MTIRPKKVLFIGPSAYPLGGVATWLDYLLPGLKQRGWQCVIGLVKGEFHNANYYLEQHPFESAISIQSSSGTRQGRIRNLVAAIRETCPDIVVGVNIPDTYVAAEIVKKKYIPSLKSIMTIHGLQADLMQDVTENECSIDAVICTNRLACRVVEVIAGFDRQRVMYAPYGVPEPERTFDVKHDASPLLISHVGRLEQDQKRILDIPAIAAELQKLGVQFEIAIAGTGPDEVLLLEALQKVGLQNKVQFLGQVAYEELPAKVYGISNVLLLTSEWETGPIVAWEAMSRGVVVVTSAYTGSQLENSLIHGENCLMFPVGDHRAAAHCISRLQDVNLRAKLSRAGIDLVQSKYSLQTSIEAWESCFDQVMGLPARSKPALLPKVPRQGRLDHIFGVSVAERLRQLLGIRFRHTSAGGEWPHSYGSAPSDQRFFSQIGKLDVRSE